MTPPTGDDSGNDSAAVRAAGFLADAWGPALSHSYRLGYADGYRVGDSEGIAATDAAWNQIMGVWRETTRHPRQAELESRREHTDAPCFGRLRSVQPLHQGRGRRPEPCPLRRTRRLPRRRGGVMTRPIHYRTKPHSLEFLGDLPSVYVACYEVGVTNVMRSPTERGVLQVPLTSAADVLAALENMGRRHVLVDEVPRMTHLEPQSGDRDGVARAGDVRRVAIDRAIECICIGCYRRFNSTGPAAAHARSARHSVAVDYRVRFTFVPVEALR